MDDEDDALYSDDEEDDENIEDGLDFEAPMTENRRGEKYMVFETRGFRNAMRRLREEESKLDDFGKHPAYQKKVMELPTTQQTEQPDYYDMNDDSLKSEEPYGKEVGDSAPFEINPEAIDNAITEAINRFKKKSNRR